VVLAQGLGEERLMTLFVGAAASRDPVLVAVLLLQLMDVIEDDQRFLGTGALNDQVWQQLADHEPRIACVGHPKFALRVLVPGPANREIAAGQLDPLTGQEFGDHVKNGAVGFLLVPANPGVVVAAL
jgi:hypothetical protein